MERLSSATKRGTIESALNSQGESAAEASPEAEVTVDGVPFELRLCTAYGYRYRLMNDDLVLMIAPNPRASMGCVRAQYSSALLWREGWRSATERGERLVRAMLHARAFTRPHGVARLDLCADFQGWQPIASDLDRFVTRANYRAVHKIGDALSGFTFGKGDASARIYDKTLEIVQSGKEWMRAIWVQGEYDCAAPVWRLEFQLRRPMLREMDLGCLSAASEGLARLWNYLTAKWLRLVVPGVCDRRELWDLDPVWDCLTGANFGAKGEALVRTRKRSLDRDRLERGLLGNLTSYAALARHSTLESAMSAVEVALAARLAKRGVPFHRLVDRRRRRMATLPVVA